MKKYKLIKEYPGSPELGTVCEERAERSSFCYFHKEEQYLGILKYHVENQPEYWEEVNDNIWYVVCERNYNQGNFTYFEAWTVYKIESFGPDTLSPLNYFKTKEEAEEFVIKNKPCLTLTDVSLILGGLDKKRDVYLELKRIVKTKL
jgi:hypothetical protein